MNRPDWQLFEILRTEVEKYSYKPGWKIEVHRDEWSSSFDTMVAFRIDVIVTDVFNEENVVRLSNTRVERLSQFFFRNEGILRPEWVKAQIFDMLKDMENNEFNTWFRREGEPVKIPGAGKTPTLPRSYAPTLFEEQALSDPTSSP